MDFNSRVFADCPSGKKGQLPELPGELLAVIRIGNDPRRNQQQEAIVMAYVVGMLRVPEQKHTSPVIRDHQTAVAVTVAECVKLEQERHEALAESDATVAADFARRRQASIARRKAFAEMDGRT